VPEEARRISNLSTEFLLDKPLFADVVDGFLSFIGDSPLVIHNAEFDLKFLNAELKKLGKPFIAADRAIDTVLMARRRFPGAPASLDALCRRFNIGLEERKTKGHGALLDVELLAQVYLELLGGRQPGLELAATSNTGSNQTNVRHEQIPPRPVPLPSGLSEDERVRHEAAIAALGPLAIWKQ
jgi:DNA polymerase-3 subunit epsilon